MIEVTMNREVYKEIVYLACATATDLDTTGVRDLNTVLDILEEKGERIKGQPAGYVLLKTEDKFEFEDEQAKFLIARLDEYLPKLQGWSARKALPVIDQLKAGPKKRREATAGK